MKDERKPRLQEVATEIPKADSPSDCGFCSLLCRSAAENGPSDSRSLHFMTEREMRVLASMRRLKEEVSGIKASMREMESQGTSLDESALWARLKDLKEEWKRLDKERMDAAEERMRLLGHIQ